MVCFQSDDKNSLSNPVLKINTNSLPQVELTAENVMSGCVSDHKFCRRALVNFFDFLHLVRTNAVKNSSRAGFLILALKIFFFYKKHQKWLFLEVFRVLRKIQSWTWHFFALKIKVPSGGQLLPKTACPGKFSFSHNYHNQVVNKKQ